MAPDLPTAAVAFSRAAAAMHAAIAAEPRTVAYDVRTDVHAYGDAEYRYHYDVDRAAQRALLRIDAGGPPPNADPWPIDPIFDPFARFATSGHWEPVGRQDGTFKNAPHPMTFDTSKPAGVDAFAFSVSGYAIRYATDAPVAPPYVKFAFTATPAAQRTQTVFTSAVVDTTTWLPVQITMRTPVGHSDVVIDYTRVESHPVVSHFRMARRGYSTEAWFTNVTFGTQPSTATPAPEPARTVPSASRGAG